jgi:hypothetical protein
MMRRLVLGVAAALVLGLLLGRATSAPDTAPSSVTDSAAGPGPTSEKAGVAVGFSRTREGAILAAANYQEAFADETVLDPGELGRRIRVVATAEFAPVMLEANTPGAERLRAGAFGEGVRGEVPSAYFGVPVGYRLLGYTPDRAVVQIWGFTLLGNVSSVEPTAYFGLSRTVLTWRGDDWKIADTRASFGPTPRLASPRPGGEGLGLVELTKELHRYGVAP